MHLNKGLKSSHSSPWGHSFFFFPPFWDLQKDIDGWYTSCKHIPFILQRSQIPPPNSLLGPCPLLLLNQEKCLISELNRHSSCSCHGTGLLGTQPGLPAPAGHGRASPAKPVPLPLWGVGLTQRQSQPHGHHGVRRPHYEGGRDRPALLPALMAGPGRELCLPPGKRPPTPGMVCHNSTYYMHV